MEEEPDKRVVQKLQSSMDFLKESLLNYFEGRLEAEVLNESKAMAQKNKWNLLSLDHAATR